MTNAQLRPCPTCARHARVSDDACPFCGAPFTEVFQAGPRPQPPSARLSRAALFAFGSGTLALAPGCGSPGGTTPPDSGSSVNFAPPYGAFPFDSSVLAVPDDGGPDNVDAEPIGGPCSTSDDCGSGASCLFPVGGGCTAQGRCEVQSTCTPQSSPIVLCVCAIGGLLELQCAPAGGYSERTTMGACPGPDAATDASAEDAMAPMDAADTGETEP